MNLIVDNAKQRKAVIRSALLTTGFGPIVKYVYKTLMQHTDLRVVVLSKKASSRWKKLNVYGLWYTLQYLISRIIYSMTGSTNIRPILPAEIGVRIWKSRKDQDYMREWLKNLDINVVFVCDFPHILPKEFFTKFKYCINIHPSLLPNYRGPKPIIWGLLDKSSEFGITLQLIDEGIDTGDIICQRAIGNPILPLSILVEMKLAKILPELIKFTIGQMQLNNLHTRKQEGGFYLSFPTLANRRIRKQMDCRTSS